MRSCEVWLNGKRVGRVEWDPLSRAIEIRCALKEGWIYRAVLFCEGKETFHFGVLVPGKDGFFAKGVLPESAAQQEHQHCEVLRSLPGEAYVEGTWLTKSQVQPWISGVFPLEQAVSRVVEKKFGVYYRIYNRAHYLLLPIETDREDPLIELYCTGKPIRLEGRWYLCVRIDEMGKIIPWTRDEN